MAGSRTDLPGLQVERTVLAWDRTALALLVNGALLLLRHLLDGGTAALAPAVLALALVLLVAALGRARGRRLRGACGPLPGNRVAVTLAGVAVVVVGLGVLAALLPGLLADLGG